MANLVQSGVLLPGETNEYCNSFNRYDLDELLQILDESNKQRIPYESISA
jgi:hypothetical protein